MRTDNRTARKGTQQDYKQKEAVGLGYGGENKQNTRALARRNPDHLHIQKQKYLNLRWRHPSRTSTSDPQFSSTPRYPLPHSRETETFTRHRLMKTIASNELYFITVFALSISTQINRKARLVFSPSLSLSLSLFLPRPIVQHTKRR